MSRKNARLCGVLSTSLLGCSWLIFILVPQLNPNLWIFLFCGALLASGLSTLAIVKASRWWLISGFIGLALLVSLIGAVSG